jgi:hypothetical protein
MNQEEFLQKLAASLAPLSDMERARILDYYREMICDAVESGRPEQEIIAAFGAPETVAAEMLENAESDGTGSAPHLQVCPAGESEPTGKASSPRADSAARAEQAVPSRSVPGSQNTFPARGKVHSVVICAQHTAVELHPVQEGPVCVHFNLSESDHVSVSESNGVFEFQHQVEYSLFHWHELFSGPRRITVDIPVAFEGELHVSTCNARVSAVDLGKLTHVEFITSNAQLSAKNFCCTELYLHTSNGALTLRGVQGENGTAETSNGRMEVQECTFAQQMRLHTNNAAIHVQNVQSDAMDFSTNNGVISGYLIGDMRDYGVRSHTSNASNNLPPELVYPEQSKFLEVHTSNARIDLHFISQHR